MAELKPNSGLKKFTHTENPNFAEVARCELRKIGLLGNSARTRSASGPSGSHDDRPPNPPMTHASGHPGSLGDTFVFTSRPERTPRQAEGCIPVKRVGARELKQHTGEIIERVRMGERVLITHRGEGVAVISPVDQEALREALASEAGRADRETLGWLAASEGAFSFWENEDDAIWDEIGNRADEGAEG